MINNIKCIVTGEVLRNTLSMLVYTAIKPAFINMLYYGIIFWHNCVPYIAYEPRENAFYSPYR